MVQTNFFLTFLNVTCKVLFNATVSTACGPLLEAYGNNKEPSLCITRSRIDKSIKLYNAKIQTHTIPTERDARE